MKINQFYIFVAPLLYITHQMITLHGLDVTHSLVFVQGWSRSGLEVEKISAGMVAFPSTLRLQGAV